MSSSTLNNLQDNAVKAIIYNDSGKILLQKRDNVEGLPFPGAWNFFGGLVEKNEDLNSALKRELLEEISCVPGTIDSKLFEWVWKSEWKKTNNHFYPILFSASESSLSLNEGQEMKWFSLNEIIKLSLVPAIYHNLSKIFELVHKKKDANQILKEVLLLEESFMFHNSIEKKNERVFYSKLEDSKLSKQQIILFKELSIINNQGVTRICLHQSDSSSLHEMIMVHTKPAKIGPLKQDKASISYHIIDGSIEVKIYDELENIKKLYTLKNLSFSDDELNSIRIKPNDYRTVSSLSNYAIFLEITNGPFEDNDTLWLNAKKNKNV